MVICFEHERTCVRGILCDEEKDGDVARHAGARGKKQKNDCWIDYL